jgi:hypothetical protein
MCCRHVERTRGRCAVQGVPIRAVFVEVPKEMCMHMNSFRGCNPKSEDPRAVGDVTIHSFYKYVEKPTVRDAHLVFL